MDLDAGVAGRRSRLSAALAFALALLWMPPAARAATLTVDSPLDVDLDDALCTLREAIVAANSDAAYHGCLSGAGADRIVFSLTFPATITLSSDLPSVTSTLLIQGPGVVDLTLDGLNAHRLLQIDSPAGGEWLGAVELTLSRGYAADFGGGALIEDGDSGYFRHVIFLNNRSDLAGGGLAVRSRIGAPTSVNVDECWFTGNIAAGTAGGGGALLLGGQLTEVTVDRTTFSGNAATSSNGSGGAIRTDDGSLTLRRCTFSENQAMGDGGAIVLNAIGADPLLDLEDSTITNNEADSDGNGSGIGGGIRVAATPSHLATLEIGNSIVAANLDPGPTSHVDLSVSSLGSFALTTHGFNLIGSNEGVSGFLAAGAPNADGDWVGTALSPIDPTLNSLASNGGFAPTHAPTATMASAVIDHGFCSGSGSDQRGYGDAAAHRRIVDTVVANGPGSDGCDIGAVERAAATGADPYLFADGFEQGHALFWSKEEP